MTPNTKYLIQFYAKRYARHNLSSGKLWSQVFAGMCAEYEKATKEEKLEMEEKLVTFKNNYATIAPKITQ